MTRRRAYALALLVPFVPLAVTMAWDVLRSRRV